MLGLTQHSCITVTTVCFFYALYASMCFKQHEDACVSFHFPADQTLSVTDLSCCTMRMDSLLVLQLSMLHTRHEGVRQQVSSSCYPVRCC